MRFSRMTGNDCFSRQRPTTFGCRVGVIVLLVPRHCSASARRFIFQPVKVCAHACRWCSRLLGKSAAWQATGLLAQRCSGRGRLCCRPAGSHFPHAWAKVKCRLLYYPAYLICALLNSMFGLERAARKTLPLGWYIRTVEPSAGSVCLPTQLMSAHAPAIAGDKDTPTWCTRTDSTQMRCPSKSFQIQERANPFEHQPGPRT